MIGCFNDYSQQSDNTVRLQLYKMISEKKAAPTPITFEEIVMVMIISRHESFSVTFENSLPQY